MLLEYGSIVHTFVQGVIPPKKKFLVCINEQLQWFLLVNSENREIYECIEILATNYPFLKNQNRFVSCSNFFKPKATELAVAQFIGKITSEDMLKIHSKIQQSKKWLPNQKQQI